MKLILEAIKALFRKAEAGISTLSGRVTALEKRIPKPEGGDSQKFLRGDSTWGNIQEDDIPDSIARKMDIPTLPGKLVVNLTPINIDALDYESDRTNDEIIAAVNRGDSIVLRGTYSGDVFHLAHASPQQIRFISVPEIENRQARQEVYIRNYDETLWARYNHELR